MEQRVQHNLFVTPPPAAWQLKIPREFTLQRIAATFQPGLVPTIGVWLCLRRVYRVAIQISVSNLFLLFFFFATRFTRFVDFVDSFVEYISKKGKRMLHWISGYFFYGNNKEISSVFAYYFLEGVWNFLHLTIIPAIKFTVEKFAQVFYSAITGLSLDKVGNKNLIFFCETVW